MTTIYTCNDTRGNTMTIFTEGTVAAHRNGLPVSLAAFCAVNKKAGLVQQAAIVRRAALAGLPQLRAVTGLAWEIASFK